MLITDLKLKCSVILLVYTRTDFVNQALLSLENQNIDKNFFEVLIISNVEINLDRSYNINLHIIISDQMTLAGKLVQGILLAKNDVITFLEDDDLYCKERILNAIEAFSKNKDLSYYHNASSHFRIKDEQEKRCTHNNDLRKGYRALKFKDQDTIVVYEKYLDERRADFNLSSMAFRKNFLIGYADLISTLGTRYVDSFIFFIAIYRGDLVIIDDKNLTMTRVHSKNASQSVEINGKSSSHFKYSDDMEKVIALLDHLGLSNKRFIQKWLKIRRFDDNMKSDSISRRYAFITMANLFKQYKLNFIKSDVAIKGIAYMVSPKLMKKMLIMFHST